MGARGRAVTGYEGGRFGPGRGPCYERGHGAAAGGIGGEGVYLHWRRAMLERGEVVDVSIPDGNAPGVTMPSSRFLDRFEPT